MSFFPLCKSLSRGLSSAALLAVSFALSAPAQAQTNDMVGVTPPVAAAGARPLVTLPVDDSKLVSYKNSVPSQTETARDEGRADGSLVIAGQIVLHRPLEEQQAVELLEHRLHSKHDPLYQQWLTPRELADSFAPADSDIATLESWMESHGLTVDSYQPAQLVILFSGPVSKVEAAFNTEIHTYKTDDGSTFYSNSTNPKVPAAFDALIYSPLKLDNFSPIHMQNYAGHVIGAGKISTSSELPSDGSPEAIVAPVGSKATPLLSGLNTYTLVDDPGTQNFGTSNPQTLTVTLVGTSGSGAITGTLTITNPTIGTIENVTVQTSGNCVENNHHSYSYTCTFTWNPAANQASAVYTLTANYGGNSAYSSATTTDTFTVYANTANTTTATANPTTVNPTVPSTTVTSTTTWTGSGATPTGTVSLSCSASSAGTCNPLPAALTVNSTNCTINTSAKTFSCPITYALDTDDSVYGTYYMVMSYSGDVTYAASSNTTTSTPVLDSINDATSVTVTANPTTTSAGSNIVYTIVLSSTHSTAYTGTITISGTPVTGSPNVVNLSTCTHSGDSTTCTETYAVPAATAAGTYTVTAAYSGDATYGPSSGTASVTVTNVTSALAAAPATVAYAAGTAVALTDTLTFASGVTPVGADTITFTNSAGVTAIGSMTISQCTHSGQVYTCTFNWTPPAGASGDNVGSYTITAAFSGDGTANPTSATTPFSITKQTPTFGAMTFSPAATEPYGTSQIITISDTLIFTGGGLAPTGAVTYVLNSVTYTASCTGSTSPLTCTATVSAATIAALPVNTYTVTAGYATDTNYAAATGTSGTFNITKGTFTTVNMTTASYATPPTPTTQAYGTVTPFTVYAVLSPAGATSATAADVTFTTSTAGIGAFGATTCAVVSGVDQCHATFTPNGTAVPGSYNINVSFSGDSNYNAAGPSTNGTGLYVVTKGTPTVSLSAVTAQYGTTTGQAITVTATGDNGAIATFGTAGGVGGSFSPTTCTIATNTCSSTYSPSGTLAVGTYTNDLTVSVAATTNYNAGTATSTLTISKHSTTTTLTVAPTTVSAASQQAVFTSTTSYATSAGLQATGTLTLSATGGTWVSITGIAFPAVGLTTSSGSGATDGGYTYSCTTNLVAQSVTCVVTVPLAYSHLANGGTRTMTSTYSGDTNYGTSNGTTSLTVAGTSTATLTLSSPAPVAYGSGATVSFTATLNGSYTATNFLQPAVVYPSGTITLTNPTLGALNTITLNSSGSTPCTVSYTSGGSFFAWTFATKQVCTITYTVPVTTAAGAYSITGTYSGDTMFEGATATGTLTISPATLSSIVLSADTPGSTAAGVTSVNLTATVNPVLPGVTVNFNDASTGASYTAVTDASGQASVAVTTASTGVSAGLNAFNATVTANSNYGAAGPSNTVNLYLQGLLVTTTLKHNFTGLISYGSPAITVEGTVDGTKLGPFGIVVYNFTPLAQTVGLNFVNAGSGAFSYVTNCPAMLPAGKTCNYYFYYMPPNGDGCNPTVNCGTDGSGYPEGTYETAAWQITTGVLLGIGDTGFDRSGPVAFPATLAGKAVLGQTSPITVTPLSHTFGPLAPNALSSTLTIVVTNSSASSVGLSYTPPVTTPFQATNYCPSNLAANASCNINVTFQSGSTGTVTDAIGITPAGGSAISVSLTGIVNSNTGLTLSTTAHNFGNAATGTTATAFGLSITNNAGIAAALSFATTQSGSTPFDVGTGGCPSTLAAGAQCSVIVNFSPTAVGTFNDVLTVTSDQPILPNGTGSSPNYSAAVTFSGAGVASGQFTASSVAHNWGNVTVGTTPSNYGVQLTNTTPTALTLSLGSGFSQGMFGFGLAGTNCSSTLAVNESCELIFSFSPTGAGQVTTTYGVTAVDTSSNPVQLYSGGNPYSAITLLGTGQ
jgi:hypothetical protein